MSAHVEAFARYASLVSRQLEALDGEDLETVESLAAERDEVQRAIEGLGPLPALTPELATQLREMLAMARRNDQALRQRLLVARQEALEAVRLSGRTHAQLTAYAGSQGPVRAALDITF